MDVHHTEHIWLRICVIGTLKAADQIIGAKETYITTDLRHVSHEQMEV